MKELKIGKKDTIICYESSADDAKPKPFKWAARVAWTLSAYGIEDIHIMDGGYPRW